MSGEPNYVQRVLDELTTRFPKLDADLARLYALLVLTRGASTTLADVHDAWALWRNTTNPAHPSLVPLGELAPEVVERDRKYVDAIHEIDRRVG
jgi:hypothetical protein